MHAPESAYASASLTAGGVRSNQPWSIANLAKIPMAAMTTIAPIHAVTCPPRKRSRLAEVKPSTGALGAARSLGSDAGPVNGRGAPHTGAGDAASVGAGGGGGGGGGDDASGGSGGGTVGGAEGWVGCGACVGTAVGTAEATGCAARACSRADRRSSMAARRATRSGSVMKGGYHGAPPPDGCTVRAAQGAVHHQFRTTAAPAITPPRILAVIMWPPRSSG